MKFRTFFFALFVGLLSVVTIANEKPNSASSYYSEALELLKLKPDDYLTRTHEKLLLAAKNGHPRASTMLYINYYNGSGTEKNLALARYLTDDDRRQSPNGKTHPQGTCSRGCRPHKKHPKDSQDKSPGPNPRT